MATMSTDRENNKAQMRRGALELCVLALVSKEELYPSDILEQLERCKLIVVEGTLYPILTRLKNEGYLSYRWIESNAGPPRKYYKITAEGEVFLSELKESWNDLSKAVEGITKKGKL
jgi:PadR family transcriptional regulator, regulatory protein PadR